VDGFIDRLAELLKSLFGSEERTTTSQRPIDPDVQAAWEELDEYMRTGSSGQSGRSTSGGSAGRSAGAGRSEGSGRSAGGAQGGAKSPRRVDESLRQDYANLEVPFEASAEEVRASYKRLMLKYHPDKYPGDPEKQKIALEIAKKINQSFERIRRSS